MKITCALSDFNFPAIQSDLDVVLYGQRRQESQGSAGGALKADIARQKVIPAPRAWDFLSLALGVMAADLAGHRNHSPDGWTRDFELTVSVADASFWSDQANTIQSLLAYLTTDRWRVNFVEGGFHPEPPRDASHPDQDCVALLSGGLDSFIGLVDLTAEGHRPFAISQTVRGDADKQRDFAQLTGAQHFQANHTVDVPDPENPPSQRARSIIFFAYGILFATALERYHRGETVPLYISENGLMAINPPLTGGRLGSLSTRTTHPVVLALLQRILDAAGLRVVIENPYRHKTKGEMMRECRDQALLQAYASTTTSCGRFLTNGYQHCGRCVPCLVRRASFHAWGHADSTSYIYDDLSINDPQHSAFDDVRSALIGIEENRRDGTERWIGASLSSSLVPEKPVLVETVARGLEEVAALLSSRGVT